MTKLLYFFIFKKLDLKRFKFLKIADQLGGGSGYPYIRVLPDEFLLKPVVIKVDFKRNSSGRTRIYEYAHPPN